MQTNINVLEKEVQSILPEVKIIKTDEGFKFTRYGLEGEIIEALSNAALTYKTCWAIKRSGKGLTVIFEGTY